MNLADDAETPGLCPLMQILALAIADRALEGVDSVQDLAKHRPS